MQERLENFTQANEHTQLATPAPQLYVDEGASSKDLLERYRELKLHQFELKAATSQSEECLHVPPYLVDGDCVYSGDKLMERLLGTATGVV